MITAQSLSNIGADTKKVLQFVVNNNVVAAKELLTGSFIWDIPLSKIIDMKKEKILVKAKK